MPKQYKLILSSTSFHQSIAFNADIDLLTIGTHVRCDERLPKDLFFTDVQFTLLQIDNHWELQCNEAILIDNSCRRKTLKHNDTLTIYYQKNQVKFLTIKFLIDFDDERKDYSRLIDIKKSDYILIGATEDATIKVNIPEFNGQYIILERQYGQLYMTQIKTNAEVFLNNRVVMSKQKIENYDFIHMNQLSFYFKDNGLFTTKSDVITVQNGVKNRILQEHHTVFQYPVFHRNTRVKYNYTSKKISVKHPPQRPIKSKKNLLITLLPALSMLVLTVLLRMNSTGGHSFVLLTIATMSVTMLVTLLTAIYDVMDYKRQIKNRQVTYLIYLDDKIKVIESEREKERAIRHLIYTPVEEQIKMVGTFNKRLFEKHKTDDDFLVLYLGKGNQLSVSPIEIQEIDFMDMTDEISMKPEQIKEKYAQIDDMPIVVDLKTTFNLGIYGPKSSLLQLMINLTVDIVTRHFYQEVKLIYVLTEGNMAELRWIRWLNHIKASQYDYYQLAYNEESQQVLLEYIYQIFSTRENNVGDVFDVYYVIFVQNIEAIRTHPIIKYVENSDKYGVHFIFFTEHIEKLPVGCGSLIELLDSHNAQLIDVTNGDKVQRFIYPIITKDVAERIAIKLSPVKIDEISLEQQLTKYLTIFELLNILAVDDLNLKDRWAQSRVTKTLSAPIGVKLKKEIVYLDISDGAKGHGPHGLVAGTTGSGKSEILQSYILSMATLYHPYEVSFVLIDFKGGGMANQLKALPHLLGVITNIDGREINRSLLSIKAELIKRQEIFSTTNVNHINDYIRLYQTHQVDIPLPHLIIIVDEFAELKSEYPDFMKELISTARIGRTLGIHLILATQKPNGIVDSQIWSNSKFKLCLKVQSHEDSMEVLKTPLASEIVEPGRAYFQVGNNEIFELFQSAYSGAPVPNIANQAQQLVEIYERNLWGKKTLKFTNKKLMQLNKVTQLQSIVSYIANYCKNEQIEELPGIYLPSLSDSIDVNDLIVVKDKYIIPVGIIDNPMKQLQTLFNLDLLENNIFVVGSSGTGKTTLLQTILYGLMTHYSSDEVHIYIIDCDKLTLKLFEKANQVGGVVTHQDSEKSKNLVKLLMKIFDERKQLFTQHHVGTFKAYLELNVGKLPLITVLIDNLMSYKECFESEFEQLSILFREGIAVGINFIVTATQSSVLPYRLQSNFSEKLALNCIDTNDYHHLFGNSKLFPKDVVGRGICLQDKSILEFQVAILGVKLREFERNTLLHSKISEMNIQYSDKALSIPVVPSQFTLENVLTQTQEKGCNQFVLPIGMDFETVDFEYVDFRKQSYLALVGAVDKRVLFLSPFIQLNQFYYQQKGIEIIIIDDAQQDLKGFENSVEQYTHEADAGAAFIDEFIDKVMSHHSNNFKLLVIHHEDIIRAYQSDTVKAKKLVEFMKIAYRYHTFIVLSGVFNQVISFSATDFSKYIKDQKQVMTFMSLKQVKLFDVPIWLSKDEQFDMTMAYYFVEDRIVKLRFLIN